MWKKLISFLLLFGLVLFFPLLSSCDQYDIIDDTTSDTEGSDETTRNFLPENLDWRPEFDTPWQYSPEYDMEKSEDYDFEITVDVDILRSEKIEAMFAGGTCHIVNKTGKPFRQYGSAFIEKFYPNAFRHDDMLFGDGWIRIPYVDMGDFRREIFYDGEGTYKLDLLHSYTMHYFGVGEYRVVIFLDDGPHYAYFEITE